MGVSKDDLAAQGRDAAGANGANGGASGRSEAVDGPESRLGAVGSAAAAGDLGSAKIPGDRGTSVRRPGAAISARRGGTAIRPGIKGATRPAIVKRPAAIARTEAPETKTTQSTLAKDDKLERLELVHKVAKQLVASLDLQELMQKLFSEILDATDAEAGSLWMVDKDRNEMVCQVADGPDGGSKVVGLRIPVGTGVVGWVGQKGKSTIVYDTTKDSRFSKAADRKTGFVTKTMICAPLVFKGEVLGAVQIINRKNADTQFTDDDLNLLEDIAGYGAISINNARLYQSQQQVKNLQAILKLSEEMSSNLDRDKILITAVNASKELIPFDRAIIALEENGKAKVAAISGQSVVDKNDKNTRLVSDVLEFLLSRNQEIWIPDVEAYLAKQDALPQLVGYFRNRPETRALWARILKDEEGVLGIFAMESGKTHFIAKDQFEVLTILSAQATVALRNAQLYARVPFVGVWERLKAQGGATVTSKVISAAIVAALVALVFILPNPFTTVSASFEIAPQMRRPLYAAIDGTVQAVLCAEGDKVKQNEPLVRFDTTSLEMDILRKQGELDDIELKFREQVDSPDPLTEKRYRRAQQELELLLIQLERAQVRSPIEGVVVTPNLHDLEGKLLRESDEIAVVASIARLRIEVAVSESARRFLHEPGSDQSTHQLVKLKVGAYRDRTFSGRISAIAPQAVDKEQERVFIATVEIENEVDPNTGDYLLRPGMTGRAEIEIEPMTLFRRFMMAIGR